MNNTTILPRREFLQLLGLGAGSAYAAACGGDWAVPADMVESALRGPGVETFQDTVCGMCDAGCGITVRLVDGIPVGIRGNTRHPVNRGGLCPVGHAGLEVLYAPERIRGPQRRDGRTSFQPTTWEDALGDIGQRLATLNTADSGHRFALLSDQPGRMFDGFARGFAEVVGSANYSASRLLPTLGYQLTQGIAAMPAFDLAHADLVVSFGMDLYEDGPSPMHAIATMVGTRPDGERCSLIHVGSRLSPSAAKADEYLPILPGTLGAAALGIAHVLVREGHIDRDFVEEHTFGFHDWVDDAGARHRGFEHDLLEKYYPDRAARLCGCRASTLVALARRIARATRPVVLAGREVHDGDNGTFSVMAIHSLNALLGAFDRPGGVVVPPEIPLTPPPRASTTPSGSLFGTGTAGLGEDPVKALADRILEDPQSIEVLFIIGANPIHDSPHGERLREALDRVPMVVVFSPFQDETTQYAHYVLPPPVYLETWPEITAPGTIPFGHLGLGKPVLRPLFDTRHPGDVLLELARALGSGAVDSFPWTTYEDYLKDRLRGLLESGEGSVISGSFEEDWTRFLGERGWRFLEHSDLEGLWNDLVEASAWWNPVHHAGDWARIFPTPSGRFEFFSLVLRDRLQALGADSAGGDAQEALQRGVAKLGLQVQGDEACLPHFEPSRLEGRGEVRLLPFQPLTARGPYASVSRMVLAMFGYPVLTAWQTWLEISPTTAHELHIQDGDTVRVESERGGAEAVVRLNTAAVPGVANIALGLGHRDLEGPGRDVGSNPLAVVLPGEDSLAGTASLNSTRVQLKLVRRRAHGGPVPADGGHL